LSTALLLVSTTTNWLGTARIPRGLARAGFDVDLLAPAGSLAESSRHVRTIHPLPVGATPRDFDRALAASVAAAGPRVVVPCDDMAFRLLADLALRLGPQPAGPIADLRQLIVDSLGDPRYYRDSVDKTALPALATSLDVDVPPHAIVAGFDAAARFAAGSGFPVVIKRAHGFAGQGVAICRSPQEVAAALRVFDAANRDDPLEPGASTHLAQAWVEGRTRYFHALAWRGELRAGWALEKLVAHPHPTGPPTVSRYFHAPALAEITARLIRGCGMSGFLFAEFIVDAGERPWLLEINRRVSPATHRGEARGVDFCAALQAAVSGTPSASRTRLDDGETGISVHFPQEWLRDPASAYLRDYPADVPWDEPELLERMLALRSA
jgi:hypothetical protein